MNKNLTSSDNHLEKIKMASAHSIPFIKSFEEISKNDGIAFLFLDPSEAHLQLIHHVTILGGNWNNPSKQAVAILGMDDNAKPVQIIQKSIKNIKEKPFSFEEIASTLDDEDSFTALKNPKVEFLFKNNIAIPHFLTKAFIKLESTDPFSVAKTFISAIMDFDDSSSTQAQDLDAENSKEDQEHEETEDTFNNEEEFDSRTNPPNSPEKRQLRTKKNLDTIQIQDYVLHVIQFCHLCSKGKITPVLYSLSSSIEIENWFSSLPIFINTNKNRSHLRKENPSIKDSDNDTSSTSPDRKISRRDDYLINTMIKLHDTMDKNTKNKEEKDPGFNRLEDHRKKLILNASAVPPFEVEATTPSEFYLSFLSKKSQFKAKDMLVHRFQLDKIAFNPNPTFITNLWNCEFFWLLPDSPSGVSVFYCQETKSTNANELEKERYLALADKIKPTDIEKLSKQKMYLPTSIMDLVWMTQNFNVVISLCFGPESHSSIFLKDWTNHIYDNRLIYSSIYASDPHFYAKILFTIDNALQIHWRSCTSATDRLSVNDRVLRKTDIQDSILRLNFNQMLPKSINDKILLQLENYKEGKVNGGSKHQGKKFSSGNQDQNKEIIYDNDKNHSHWRLKENEKFAKVFYKNQKECPKDSDGKHICMKFFLRGICNKSCSRSHNLSKEDEKKFETFINKCREGASKPDF
jgi:hypothetical protein